MYRRSDNRFPYISQNEGELLVQKRPTLYQNEILKVRIKFIFFLRLLFSGRIS